MRRPVIQTSQPKRSNEQWLNEILFYDKHSLSVGDFLAALNMFESRFIQVYFFLFLCKEVNKEGNRKSHRVPSPVNTVIEAVLF